MNRAAFYDALRPSLGALTQANVVGFELCLDEGTRRKTPLGSMAYVLATAWWESGRTMAPVEEGYYLGSRAKAFQRKLRYYPFYGRGLVQLTHEFNYRWASGIVGEDLVKHPERALDVRNSVTILFEGCITGAFTGKALDDYIDEIDESDAEDFKEYKNARRVVNGTDKDYEIARLAVIFEEALRAGHWGTPETVPTVPTSPPVPPVSPSILPPPSAALNWFDKLILWIMSGKWP